MYRWSTLALPQVEWPAQTAPPSRFRHLHTTVEGAESARVRELGHTAWQSIEAGPPVRLTWDWALIDDGVIVIADPMGIHSNLRFLHDGGGALQPNRAALHLNAMVHALPWQTTILRALRRLRGDDGTRSEAALRRRRDDVGPAATGMAWAPR